MYMLQIHTAGGAAPLKWIPHLCWRRGFAENHSKSGVWRAVKSALVLWNWDNWEKWGLLNMLHNYTKDDWRIEILISELLFFHPSLCEIYTQNLSESWLMVNMGSILPVASSKMCCMHCSLYGWQLPLPNIVSWGKALKPVFDQEVELVDGRLALVPSSFVPQCHAMTSIICAVPILLNPGWIQCIC